MTVSTTLLKIRLYSLTHPQNSPDLLTCVFHIFGTLKKYSLGRQFASDEEGHSGQIHASVGNNKQFSMKAITVFSLSGINVITVIAFIFQIINSVRTFFHLLRFHFITVHELFPSVAFSFHNSLLTFFHHLCRFHLSALILKLLQI